MALARIRIIQGWVSLVVVHLASMALSVKSIFDSAHRIDVSTMVILIFLDIQSSTIRTHVSGTCNITANSTFECLCRVGWTGEYCEKIINHCEKNLCLNNGVCRPSFLNYTCECLGNSYSGRHCEIISQSTYVRQMVSKSFAYIAIIALALLAMFVVLMDVLKYGFGIDPVKHEWERLRLLRLKKLLKRRRKPIVIRFKYVN